MQVKPGYDGLVSKQGFEYPGPYVTAAGRTIPLVRIGFETIGTLNAAGDNAILIPHYFSGTSHFAGRYSRDDALPGYWDALVGPGLPLDTDRYFLIGVDSLCNVNAYDGFTVTTGPSSPDPATGALWGLRFPIVQIRDFVQVQRALLDALGVRRLHAVMGASMGSLQSFEWAALYPDIVDRLIAAVPAARMNDYAIARLQQWRRTIMLDPAWNGGNYASQPLHGLIMALRAITIDALAPEWAEENFGRAWADPDADPAGDIAHEYAVNSWIDQLVAARAPVSDANNLIYLTRANELFTVGGKRRLAEGLRSIRAPALLLPSLNDHLLFPDQAREIHDLLHAQGNRVAYQELEGPFGHLNGLYAIGQAGETIRQFLAS